MLKIIVNKKEVDLGKLKSITLKFNGGVFDLDKIEGSYSIPFKLDLNTINREIFEYPLRVENINTNVRQYSIDIWHSGIILTSGIVTASIFDTTISCRANISNGHLYNLLNQWKLNEHQFGGLKTYTSKAEYTPDVDDYALYNVYNADFLKDCRGYDFDWTGSAYESLPAEEKPDKNQNLYLNNQFEIPEFAPAIITPFPYLFKVLNYLFTGLGFNYTDDFFTTDILKYINIFNVNNAVDYTTVDYSGEDRIKNVLNGVDIRNHLPEMTTSDFIIAIQNHFNIFFKKDNNKSVTVVDRNAMLQSELFSDFTDKIIGEHTKKQSTKKIGYIFKIKRDDNDANVTWMQDVANKKKVTYLDYGTGSPNNPIPGEDAFCAVTDSETMTYYECVTADISEPIYSPDIIRWEPFNYDPEWRQQISQQQSIVDSEQQFVIDTKLSTVTFCDIGGAQAQHNPRVVQLGNHYLREGKVDFSLRLMSYKGIQSIDGKTQPYGHVASLGETSRITPYISFLTYWEKAVQWLIENNSIEYNQSIKLSAAQIKSFDFTERKLIEKNKYFIKDFSVKLNRTTISPAKCTMIKAPVLHIQ